LKEMVTLKSLAIFSFGVVASYLIARSIIR